jgi:hypothetical protein
MPEFRLGVLSKNFEYEQGERSVAEVEVRRNTRTRTAPLGASELGRISEHLSAGGDEPLRIGI